MRTSLSGQWRTGVRGSRSAEVIPFTFAREDSVAQNKGFEPLYYEHASDKIRSVVAELAAAQ
jgi:hypothetical protein